MAFFYDKALVNMKNVLQCYEDMNLSLSNEKCFILRNNRIVLGHHISTSLVNMKSVLQCCEDMNLSLNNEKCFMLRNNRIVLGHHISTFSTSSVEVDLAKISMIQELSIPQN